MVSSSTYFLPLKVLTFFAYEYISTYLLPLVNYFLYLMGNPPYSTKVPTPVPVKKDGIPAPPDLIFYARVPWGVISSSSSPSRYCLSNSAFSPTYEEIILLICLLRNKTARPQSFYPVLSPNPQLLEITVRSLTPNYFTPWMRFIGTPQIPKPPTRILEPSVIPSKASWSEPTTLLIFWK